MNLKHINNSKKYFEDLISKYPVLSKFITDSSILILAATVISLINYVFHLLSARLFSIQDFGVFQTLIQILSMLTVLTVLIRLQLTKELSKLVSKNKRDSANALFSNFLLKLIIIGSITAGFVIVVIQLGNLSIGNIQSWQLSAVAIIALFSLIIVSYRSYMRSWLSFFQPSVNGGFQAILRILLVLPTIYLGYRLGGAVVALVMVYIITIAFSYYQTKSQITYNFRSKTSIKGGVIAKDTFKILIGYIGLISLISIDLILVQKFIPASAGFYAGVLLFGKVIFFLTTPISNVLFPSLIHAENSGESKKLFIFATLVVAAISLVVLALYTVFPQQIVSIALSETYLPIAGLLAPYSVFIFFYSILYVIVNGFIALENYVPSYITFAGALMQFLLITRYHSSLNQVIIISLTTCFSTLVSVILYSLIKYKPLRHVKILKY